MIDQIDYMDLALKEAVKAEEKKRSASRSYYS